MQTILEQLLGAASAPPDPTVLTDPRVQVFSILANNPATSFSIGELSKMVKVDRRKLQVMMNMLFQHDLLNHDFNTRTYKYKDCDVSHRLKNQIEMLRAL